ncbi:hypothetical protein AWB74_01725 [Caballeronia arvi]|uniref:Uncharacterized protein n=1 Tax=Caballeronia arvi TaxID=1777135 RepID=A0A158HE03_9BURK|nr:BrxA family protein [Caballeronia arvi]SAL42407.1 hypothetical protein AWB74_01725 [Caballeronia arvi]
MTLWNTGFAAAYSPGEEGVLTLPSRPDTNDRFGRDPGPYSTRNSSKGSLITESHIIFRALASGKSVSEVRDACLAGKLLRQAARETRRRIWESLHWRFFAWNPPSWVLADLASAARNDVTSPSFVGLVYVHYARRDRLTLDFVADRLWPSWKSGGREVRRADVTDYLANSGNGQPAKWRESTRIKLAGNVLSALRDFGVLTGVQRKTLQRPVVAPEVVLHLCRLLDLEGLRGRAFLEARDWRLFLCDIQDTSQALAQLAQRGDIRFERSGRTVIIEVPKDPAGGNL